MSTFSSFHTMLLSHVIFRNKIKTLLYAVLYTVGAKFTVQLINIVCCTSTDSEEVPHTERSRWFHDPSHTFPTISIPVLSAALLCTHSLTYILNQILLPSVEHYLFPHPVPQTHITVHIACYFNTHNHRY
jgi:hypothetical protein